MKVLVVVLAIIAAAVAADWAPKSLEELKALRKECLESSSLPAETLEKIKSFEFPDEEPVRKYALCLGEKWDLFCGMEGYHPDRIAKQFKQNLDESEALAIAEKCADKNEQKSSVEVWAFRGHQCLLNSKLGEAIKAYLKKGLQPKA